MPHPYDLLDVAPEATSAELKAAYHRKLRQFPAHSHPQEFQQIRAAYETIRAAGEHRGDPLQPGPLLDRLDPEALVAIDTRLRASCRLSLTDLLRLTF
jgi:hypothetical protein